MSKLVKNTGWGLVGALGSAPVVFVLSVALARGLEPAVHGQLQAVLSLWVVVSFVGQMGWVAACIHRLRRAQIDPARVAHTALLGALLMGGTTSFVLWVAGDLVRERLLLGLSQPAYTWVLAVPVFLLGFQIAGGMARGLDRFRVWTGAQLSLQLMRLVVVGGVLWAELGLGELILGFVLVQVSHALGLWGRILGETGLALTPNGKELGETAKFGAKSYLHTVTGQVHERIDLFLLAALTGDAVVVAQYAVAVGVVNRVRTLPLALSAALYPQLAGSSDEEAARATATATRSALAGILPVAVGLAVVVPVVLPWLFGEVYWEAVLPCLVLLPGTAAFSLYLVVGRYFQAIDRQGVNIAAQGTATLLNIGLNLALIEPLGAGGAALASVISYSLQGTWVVWVFHRQTGISLVDVLVVRRTDVERVLGMLRAKVNR